MRLEGHRAPLGNGEIEPGSPGKNNGQKIAVIGSGISGLSAAWGLSKAHSVTLFEKDARAGGHANTVTIQIDGVTVPVDTGFIVYNEANYPNLVALFDHLGVATAPSDMSFGASLRDGKCEYSGQTLSSVFASRANLLSPGFYRMLIDVTRFHRLSHKALECGIDEDVTLGKFLNDRNFSARFFSDFIIPMAGAIWSAPSEDILDFPANAFLKFYQNHGLLQVLNMPVWRTVLDGSREYVSRIVSDFDGTLELNARITKVTRLADGVQLHHVDGTCEFFDQLIFATHANTALSLLCDADETERNILKNFQYLPNRAVLHTDARHMPRHRTAWSAWNVVRRDGNIALTYWMNKLQPLRTKHNIFVTLNPLEEIAEPLGEWDYEHPLFTVAACKSQKDIWHIQGRGRIWYCGAHLGSGFHEDGLQSGLAVAEAIGGFRRPWTVEKESDRIYLPEKGKTIAERRI